MAEPNRRPAKALADGYALCTPAGKLLPHTYRETEADAISTLFPANGRRHEPWVLAEVDGWTVEYVYARFFSPIFFVDVVPEPIVADPVSSESVKADPVEGLRRRVIRSTVQVHGHHYGSSRLQDGADVIVHLDPHHVGHAKVFSAGNAEFIDVAICPELSAATNSNGAGGDDA